MNQDKATIERVFMGRMLVHMVGDIHQPLHTVSLFNASYPEGDRGGNSLTVYPEGLPKTNLHSYWDQGMSLFQNSTYFFKRPLDEQNSSIFDRLTASIEQLHPY